MRSAADIDDVGWPEPAAVVHLMLSILSWAPSSDARESKSSITTIIQRRITRSDDSGRPAPGEHIKWFTFHASIGAIHALTGSDNRKESTHSNAINNRRPGAAARSSLLMSDILK